MKEKTPYTHDINLHNGKSALEVVPILVDLFKPKSVVDIGCGLGDWLSTFQKNGVEKILGVDGNWVNKNNLYIKEDHFLEQNLTIPLRLNQKFDLAMSLEVAEHLPESAADTFIETLTNLSDNIVFSAAVPNQGGQNHINEQWHTYWIEKFEQKGFYCHDIIRPLIWDNEKVEWWYKQNILHFTKKIPSHKFFGNIIHYELLYEKIKQIDKIYNGKIGIRQSFQILKSSIKNNFLNND
jgi:SAM-dependent methyltransferase